MPNFAQTISPTPFGLFDSDAIFQSDADKIVVFVKTKLGDPQLSVELTNKQIWSCFEEATAEYGSIINQFQAQSELSNMLGAPTSSNITNKYAQQNLDFLFRQAEPYAMEGGLAGPYDTYMGYINLNSGQQDYNLYTDLMNQSGSVLFTNLSASQQSSLKVMEVLHFSPAAAQHFYLNASNISNFLATEFNYESFVNSTVFYTLPVYEDVLRKSMLDYAAKVRRSNYSYKIVGRNIRIYPTPSSSSLLNTTNRLWIRVSTKHDPYSPDFQDSSLNGISNLSNAPFSNLPYVGINAIGKQWIRQYTLSLCKETLGYVRSKFKTIPIPGSDLTLNGEDLLNQAKEEKDKAITSIKEVLSTLTYDKLLERDANKAEQINKSLQYIPIIGGIKIG